MLIVLFFLLVASSQAASQKELQAQIDALQKQNTDLLQATRQSAAQETAGKLATRKATSEREAAATTASTNEANLQFTAQYYAEIARVAAEQNTKDLMAARDEVAASRNEIAQLKQGQSNPFSAEHMTLYTLVGGILLSAFKAWLDSDKRAADHREVLETVDRGTAKSADALAHSNNLNQKIVDMRDDLVGAVRATNEALDSKEEKR